jgi:glycosyltransferase involved in cell wall biosynthesis
MKVSVVVTSYNKAPYTRKCIEGILEQEFDEPFELIFADDCSTDNTESIVRSFSDHSRFGIIIYTKHSENKGLMKNFIWALSQAKGEFIALCDGDDYWSDRLKVKEQVKLLESNSALIGVGTRELIVDTRNDVGKIEYEDLYFNYQSSHRIDKQDFAHKGILPFHTSTFMFRNSAEMLKRLLPYSFVRISNDIVLYGIANSMGDIYFYNESMVTRIHNDGGITNFPAIKTITVSLNFYLLYKMLANEYTDKQLKGLMEEISKSYYQKTLQMFSNRNFNYLMRELVYYLKYWNFAILGFAIKVVLKKVRIWLRLA